MAASSMNPVFLFAGMLYRCFITVGSPNSILRFFDAYLEISPCFFKQMSHFLSMFWLTSPPAPPHETDPITCLFCIYVGTSLTLYIRSPLYHWRLWQCPPKPFGKFVLFFSQCLFYSFRVHHVNVILPTITKEVDISIKKVIKQLNT